MRIEFESVKKREIKQGLCPVCSKKVIRSKIFEQTINPFNKNKNGFTKTRFEIMDELSKEGILWKPNFTCNNHNPEQLLSWKE